VHSAEVNPSGPASATAARTLPEMLLRSATAFGGREALVDGSVRLDHADALRRSATIAARLAARGIGPGDRAAILLPNGWWYAISYCGTQLAGAITVLVNARLSGPELEHVLTDSGAVVIITDDALAERVPASHSSRIMSAAELVAEPPARSKRPSSSRPRPTARDGKRRMLHLPASRSPATEPPSVDDIDLLIVGAGFSGLAVATSLKRAGLGSFRILETADDLGGTWRDNTYPGCCRDIPSPPGLPRYRGHRLSQSVPDDRAKHRARSQLADLHDRGAGSIRRQGPTRASAARRGEQGSPPRGPARVQRVAGLRHDQHRLGIG